MLPTPLRPILSGLLRFGAGITLLSAFPLNGVTTDEALLTSFQQRVQPVLDQYCFDCHGYGIRKGKMTLDEFSSGKELRADPGLWERVLRKTRAGLMPPADEPRPSSDQVAMLGEWIKRDLFGIDPQRPDPGKVTLRRLNQVEYKNTILDLTGVRFDTSVEFPPDDTGGGFDVIGEALNISPLLLEKYLDAARQIVTEAVGRDGFRSIAPAGLPAELPEAGQREEYARSLLRHFSRRAYRRPVTEPELSRLVGLAREFSVDNHRPDAEGITQALIAVLASPRFIFRQEFSVPAGDDPFPLLDEFSLAARLSYFFWSTTPDEELLSLAEAGRLRAELSAQVDRLRRDPRGVSLARNFVGQWLHTRALATTPIDDFDIFLQEGGAPGVLEARRAMRAIQATPPAERSLEDKQRYEELVALVTKAYEIPRPNLGQKVREAMRRETELTFNHLLAEDRSVLELLDSDYTFLDETLARFYGVEGVQGGEMRKVTLPAESQRGGLLTQGSFLVTTSNPGRTSPVKRGVYILENILGVPPAPPPPDIPALEEAAVDGDLTKNTLRATLAAHRENPRCASCHDAMDPLGLAFEEFNPLGRRKVEADLAGLDVSGRLITGEEFGGVSELKRVLATRRSRDFYYCLSEKLLTYALGRSLTHLDTVTVDGLVGVLESSGGKLGDLLVAIVESAPFQRRRAEPGSISLASIQSTHPAPP